jgi:hypothetical protein
MNKDQYTLKKNQILFLFVIVLVLKTCIVFYLSHLAQCAAPDRALGKIAYASGDTFSYTGAMENYIQHGSYFFYNGTENIYAGRLAHYSIPYWLFRQFFDQPTSYDLLILFQIVMESLGIVALCLLAYRLLGRSGMYLLLTFLLLSTNWTDSSYYASPESLAISALAIMLWQYERYRSTKKIAHLISSSVFFGWLVTLKVYYLLLLIPIGIEFLFNNKGALNKIETWKMIVTRSVLYVIPLVLLLMPWVVRNYFVYKKFVPLQIDQYAGYPYTKSDLACRKFIAAWGGDFIFWEKTSAGCYFHTPQQGITCDFQYPSIFSDELRKDEVESARRQYIDLQNKYSAQRDEEISKHFDRLTSIFKKHNAFYFHVKAPVILVVKFLKHSGSYYLPIYSSNSCFQKWQFIIKICESMIYWISLIIGLPGLIWLGFEKKNIILPYLPLFLIFLFPILYKTTEWRYFRTIEPVLYLGVVFVILKVFSLRKKFSLKS